jgi:cell division transport system permease protein
VGSWLLRHAQVLLSTLGELSRVPLATLTTTLLLAISLALPSALYLAVANVREATRGWERDAQVSVFLRPEVDAAGARTVVEAVRRWPEVSAATLMTPEETLAEYRALAGTTGALDALSSNPLPAVLLVRPGAVPATPGGLSALVDRLAAMPEADGAQFDQQWLRRLQALMALVERAVVVLAGLLGVGVLVVVANTTRMAILSRRAEIEIMKLFGATDAFVRRPFLYTGLWYGLLGAVLAWLLLALALAGLDGPVTRLAALYGSGFRLRALGPGGGLVLMAGGMVLGITGAWVAVGRHLRAIEP